jgi:hypothetical protein
MWRGGWDRKGKAGQSWCPHKGRVYTDLWPIGEPNQRSLWGKLFNGLSGSRPEVTVECVEQKPSSLLRLLKRMLMFAVFISWWKSVLTASACTYAAALWQHECLHTCCHSATWFSVKNSAFRLKGVSCSSSWAPEQTEVSCSFSWAPEQTGVSCSSSWAPQR